MLDRLPLWARDLVVQVAPALLAWVGTDLVPQLQGVNPVLAAFAAIAVAQLVKWATPVTRAYGYGSGSDAD